jgi:thymidine kinase
MTERAERVDSYYIPNLKEIPIQAHLEVICGPMFSAKSFELVRRLLYYDHEGRRVQAFIPKIDTRRGESINTQDGLSYPATSVSSSKEILTLIEPETDIVAIDEGQFFDKDLPEVCRELAVQGKRRVIVAGLDKNFRGEPFGPMAQLKFEADVVDTRHAACAVCGREATRTQRIKIINGERIPADYNDPLVVIGATEAYEARCRDHHEVPGQPERPEGVVLPENVEEALEWLEVFIDNLMKNEYRREAFFRALLTGSQMGDVMKYITHDPELNPPARPHGSRDDEILAYGQIIVQLLTLMRARNIAFKDATATGLKNQIDLDWKRRVANAEQTVIHVEGRVANSGEVSGTAYVVSREHPVEEFVSGILVAPFVKPDDFEHFRLNRPVAIVTDHGGVNSHPANLSRELGIPAIVGTADATEKILHGSEIYVSTKDDKGIVELDKRVAVHRDSDF